jgi:hypothetical protein
VDLGGEGVLQKIRARRAKRPSSAKPAKKAKR